MHMVAWRPLVAMMLARALVQDRSGCVCVCGCVCDCVFAGKPVDWFVVVKGVKSNRYMYSDARNSKQYLQWSTKTINGTYLSS
jgi:hypothetical protein